jgi:hypothetical protein
MKMKWIMNARRDVISLGIVLFADYIKMVLMVLMVMIGVYLHYPIAHLVLGEMMLVM